MLSTLSDIMEVSKESLKELGVLNVYLGIDSEYYINIKLLKQTKNPFFANAYSKVQEHFLKIYRFLSNSKEEGDPFWNAALRLFNYPEINEICIGLANGVYGRGLTSIDLRTKALRNAKEIIKSGFVDEDIFLYVGMFTEKVGMDLISDMISNIIIDNIKDYTKYINSKCGIETDFLKNPYKDKNIYYLPEDIVSEIPSTKWLENIDFCIQKNEEVRILINTIVGEKWKEYTSEIKKRKFVEALCSNPDIYKNYKESFDDELVEQYDFVSDKKGYALLPEIIETYFNQHSLNNISEYDNVLEFVEYFKHNVEYNNASMLIYEDDKLRNEKFAQTLFYVCALNYFNDGQFDISPEVNSGRGPVDFKIKGKKERIVVELKKLSSKQIYHGIEVQLIEYAQAENTKNAVYVVLDDMVESDIKNKKIKKIFELANGAKINVKVVIIDCRPKLSASIY